MQNFSGQALSPVIKRVLLVVVLALIVGVMFPLAMKGPQDANNAGNGNDLQGSIYTRYQGRIYMDIPFQGYYLLPNADPDSFAPLGEPGNLNLGKDKNAVYCGSQAIAQLRPDQVSFAHDGYVSDGTRAWYCTEEKPNPAYHWWQIFTRKDDEDNPGKPRAKDYMLVQLNPVNAARLKTLTGAWAQDGEHAFYEGTLIPGADGASLQTVTLGGWGYFTGRDDGHYARDRNRVYYQGSPLPGARPASFQALEPEEDQWQTLYGHDTATGQYYIGAKPFPATVHGVDSSNLHLLIANRDRAWHEIFYNASGLWYWDYTDNALKRGCANPFHASGPDQAPIMLAPGVWADDRNAFLLRASEIWRHGRVDRSLRSRNTQLWMLPGLARSQWSKVADLTDKGGTVRGTLWKAGTQLYFEPAAGQSNGFDDALYLVMNLDAFKRDIASDQYASKVLEAHDIQTIDSSDSTIACRMSSHYPGEWEFWK